MINIRCVKFSYVNYCLLAICMVMPLLLCSGCGSDSGDSGPGIPHISWVAPGEREDGTPLVLTDIAGYRVYYGATPGEYPEIIEIMDPAAGYIALSSIPAGTYYVAITVVDSDGRESALSAAVLISQ